MTTNWQTTNERKAIDDVLIFLVTLNVSQLLYDSTETNSRNDRAKDGQRKCYFFRIILGISLLRTKPEQKSNKTSQYLHRQKSSA